MRAKTGEVVIFKDLRENLLSRFKKLKGEKILEFLNEKISLSWQTAGPYTVVPNLIGELPLLSLFELTVKK